MKKLFLPILTLFWLAGCQQMEHTDTTYGGCNRLNTLEEITARSHPVTQQADTVYHYPDGEALVVFVGLNYTCCAALEAKATPKNGKIRLDVIDTCRNQDCYCRCECYYTFEFRFAGFGTGTYTYELYLDNPRDDTVVMIRKGKIEVTTV